MPPPNTLVLPYNDALAVRQAFVDHGPRIACVITEACPANMGVVPLVGGFNELLAGLCRDNGALLIMDEVLTGFRVTASGWFGLEGVAGDLTTFGKVMGGDCLPPRSAAGPRSWTGWPRPARSTRPAPCPLNPLATAAGLATLRACTPRYAPGWTTSAAVIAKLASDTPSAAGVPFRLQQAGSLFSVFLGAEQPIRDFTEARSQSVSAYAAFFHAMLEGPDSLPPSPFEVRSASAAHHGEAVERIAAALPRGGPCRRRGPGLAVTQAPARCAARLRQPTAMQMMPAAIAAAAVRRRARPPSPSSLRPSSTPASTLTSRAGATALTAVKLIAISTRM